MASRAPSLVPHSDVTVHIVLDDFGKAGRVYRETAEEHMTPSDSRRDRRLMRRRGRYPRHQRGSPDYPNHPSDVPCPLPRRIAWVRVSIASPRVQPSPIGRRVGIRIVTFEACSGFTRVTARRIAQPPKAVFVARLRPCRLPSRAAR